MKRIKIMRQRRKAYTYFSIKEKLSLSAECDIGLEDTEYLKHIEKFRCIYPKKGNRGFSKD